MDFSDHQGFTGIYEMALLDFQGLFFLPCHLICTDMLPKKIGVSYTVKQFEMKIQENLKTHLQTHFERSPLRFRRISTALINSLPILSIRSKCCSMQGLCTILIVIGNRQLVSPLSISCGALKKGRWRVFWVWSNNLFIATLPSNLRLADILIKEIDCSTRTILTSRTKFMLISFISGRNG